MATVYTIAIVLVALSIIAASIRIALGPSNADRALGADLLFFAIMGLLMIIGVSQAVSVTFDLVLVAVVIGFLATYSLARAVTKGRR